MPDRILIVDDDSQVTRFLERFFARHGYRTASAGTAAEMRRMLSREDFRLIVLDLILPDGNGIDVARELRRSSDVPLIMLTARDEVQERIVGLEIGADDYVTKPYEPHELLARVRSVLRRTAGAGRGGGAAVPAGARRMHFAGLVLDPVEMRLSRKDDDRTVPLTSTEFALLRALAETAGEALSRERILTLLYGAHAMVTDRSVDAHVARLRRKLADAVDAPPLIRTVHGTGYMLAGKVEFEAEIPAGD